MLEVSNNLHCFLYFLLSHLIHLINVYFNTISLSCIHYSELFNNVYAISFDLINTIHDLYQLNNINNK